MKLLTLLVLFLLSFTIKAENIISNASFEKGLASWKTALPEKGKAENAENFYEIDKSDGKTCLKITLGAGSQEKPATVNSATFELKEQTPYKFSISYKTKGINPNAKNAMSVRLSIHSEDGKPLLKNYKWLELPSSNTFTIKDFKNKEFITDAKAHKGYLTIFFYEKGEYWIDNVTLEAESLTDDDTSFVSEGKKFFYRPRDTEKDLPLVNIVNENASKDYILYKRNPRMMYPDSIPQREERIDGLRQFTTPGEYAVFYFSLYALKDLQISNLAISDLLDEKENKLIINEPKIKEVKFWKQASTWKGSHYYIIPELLENFEPTSVLSEKNKFFWIQFRAPENQAPGIYSGKITISFASDKKETLPVFLRILPFKLEKPDAQWGMYYSNKGSYEEMLKSLKEMNDYGINNILRRVLPAFEIKEGKVENFDFKNLSEFLKLRKEAGMQGTFANMVQSTLEQNIINKLENKKCNPEKYPFPENENKQVQEIFLSILKGMDKTIKSVAGKENSEWYYQCIDEAHQGSKMQQALWELTLARKAGVKTIGSVYPLEALEKLGGYLDISINSFITKNKKLFNEYIELGKKFNIIYWYLGGGCYGGQEGGLMPDRYHTGFLFYKTGLPCHVSWTYNWVKGDPFNDFDCQTSPEPKEACIVYPPRDKKSKEMSISTLQWEGIREGITDYKYADTLKKYIETAKTKGFSEEAEKSQKVLDKCMDYVPWGDDYVSGNCYSLPGNFTNDKADKMRWMLANEIIRLKEIVK